MNTRPAEDASQAQAAPTTQALAEGALGVALLHIEHGDLAAARPLLAEAVRGGVSTGANASLFHGAPALEFVLHRAGHADPVVQAAVDRVVTARLSAAARRHAAGRLAPLAEFDLISGLTGLAALLLTRPSTPSLLPQVLTYLVSLARPADTDLDLPGWWSPGNPAHEPVTGGYSDNGMAHGIAGPLAALALAARHGIHVPGQAHAIETFARWLETFGSSYWTIRTQLLTDAPAAPAASSPARRPSWCYGDLGIARALHLAALATGNPARRQAAEDLALTALTDPARLALITDASLCHGWAGLLTTTRAIAADSPDPGRFTDHLGHLTGCLADSIDALAKPGFMEGHAGARLALDGTDATGWTRALLLT
ncbi:lanthionine synthetase LanC family protein [Sphaerisporangium sp. NPDC051017]|uniref:lanthionine synthetase LanC family protein n=1 Tax=Sphaerisporangium sp. NPDC051017 TaxID=3154636 RepID=UPI003445FDB6